MINMKLISLTIAIMISAAALFSHPGPIDKEGGHWDQSKKEYHYHKKGKTIVDKSKKYNENNSAAAKNSKDVKKEKSIEKKIVKKADLKEDKKEKDAEKAGIKDKAEISPAKSIKIDEAAGLTSGTMTDQDGNTYKTITIGTQTWMAENLKVTHYRNGDPITNIADNNGWAAATAGAYCFFNDDIANKDIYGALYNWHAVTDQRNIAPAGWHVPTNAEVIILRTYLGSEAGEKMKEKGTMHWTGSNTGATNESGFTARPSGCRDYCGGPFKNLGKHFFLWSSTAYDERDAFEFYITFDQPYFTPCYAPKTYGLSVRLIKD